MLIDGKALAQRVREETAREAAALPRKAGHSDETSPNAGIVLALAIYNRYLSQEVKDITSNAPVIPPAARSDSQYIPPANPVHRPELRPLLKYS